MLHTTSIYWYCYSISIRSISVNTASGIMKIGADPRAGNATRLAAADISASTTSEGIQQLGTKKRRSNSSRNSGSSLMTDHYVPKRGREDYSASDKAALAKAYKAYDMKEEKKQSILDQYYDSSSDV